MNKGILLSLGVLLLTMALIGMGAVVKESLADVQAKSSYPESVKKTNYRHDNIEENIVDMVQNVAAIEMDINGSVIKISEWLPDWGNERKDNYVVSVAEYSKFISMFDDGLDVNINVDDVNLNWLVIGDVNYMHTGAGKKKKSENTIVIEVSDSVESFEMGVWPQTEDLRDVYSNCPDTGEGNLDLIVHIYPKTGLAGTKGCYDFGLDSYAQVWIDAQGNAAKDVNFVFNAGTLTIQNDKSVPVYLETEIRLDGEIDVGLIKGLVNVRDSKYGGSKK